MPTINQLVRKKRLNKTTLRNNRRRLKALEKCPQKRGIVLQTKIMDPKKPNSANRKVARVRLSNGVEVTCYIPYEGHNLQEHSNVLVKGGKVQDLPGVRYDIIRGNRDAQPPITVNQVSRATRKRGRSKCGQKKIST